MKSLSIQGVSKEFRLSSGRNRPSRRLMALEDVSFDAEPGDVIGIIGRNGAGKSTLLKIISRILRPTRGRIELNGRVGSLLEVGTGFHPDLTGRENIFLNAAILGMNQSEILKKLDAIIAFAGFEDHLDEPVKHYSSGMYMRLAFAVAAHVEPEILLIDEVLAVGDADFQRKCIERIEQVGNRGQTVLFVSHSIHTVLRLCQRAVLLEKGRVVAYGPAREVAGPVPGEQCPGMARNSAFRSGLRPPGRQHRSLARGCAYADRLARRCPALISAQPSASKWISKSWRPGMIVFPSMVLYNEWGTDLLLDRCRYALAWPAAGRWGGTEPVAWVPWKFRVGCEVDSCCLRPFLLAVLRAFP